jgi:hypothetical protein
MTSKILVAFLFATTALLAGCPDNSKPGTSPTTSASAAASGSSAPATTASAKSGGGGW